MSTFFSVISVCFLFLCLITPISSTYLINSTCRTCSNKSAFLNYNFCITTLQPVPVSHVTNLPGLALIAMGLAMQNASSTASTIQKMLNGGEEYDPFAMDGLRYCLELYVEATLVLGSSIEAFLLGEFFVADILMLSVMEGVSTCEERFMEKEGAVCPLSKENYNLFEIGEIVICIINMFSSKYSSLYSKY